MNISEELLDSVFNYKVQTNEEKNQLDLSKVQYNNLYKTYEFFEKKFAPGYNNIPGFSEVIETIAQDNCDNSPLKEYEKRLY